LRLAQRADLAPPELLLAAVGPKTLQLAGASFDGVLLHPFLTPEAVGEASATARRAAVEAGHDPARVRCIATVVVAPDRSPSDTDLVIGARAAGYFSVEGLGDALVRANGWDPELLARYRAHPVLQALGGQAADKALTRPQLVELRRPLPEPWLVSTSAAGDAAACARWLRRYLAAGADEIIVHGSTADHLAGLATAFARGPS
jgi:probable F420-dependent oxidoreductase